MKRLDYSSATMEKVCILCLSAYFFPLKDLVVYGNIIRLKKERYLLYEKIY